VRKDIGVIIRLSNTRRRGFGSPSRPDVTGSEAQITLDVPGTKPMIFGRAKIVDGFDPFCPARDLANFLE
jgi:hypothetical protein